MDINHDELKSFKKVVRKKDEKIIDSVDSRD